MAFGPVTSRSGTITLGGAAQDAMASNAQRRSWTFVNNSDTLMMVRVGADASATDGIPVSTNGVIKGEELDRISVFCAATGKAFTAWEN